MAPGSRTGSPDVPITLGTLVIAWLWLAVR
jgi:hypothetical protein